MTNIATLLSKGPKGGAVKAWRKCQPPKFKPLPEVTSLKQANLPWGSPVDCTDTGKVRKCYDEKGRVTRRGGRKVASRFVGVSYHHLTGKWQAQTRINGKFTYLGLYSTQEKAANAVKRGKMHPEAILRRSGSRRQVSDPFVRYSELYSKQTGFQLWVRANHSELNAKFKEYLRKESLDGKTPKPRNDAMRNMFSRWCWNEMPAEERDRHTELAAGQREQIRECVKLRREYLKLRQEALGDEAVEEPGRKHTIPIKRLRRQIFGRRVRGKKSAEASSGIAGATPNNNDGAADC